MKQAPIFVDAYDAGLSIHRRLGGAASPIARRTCRLALDLVETLTLALKGLETPARLDEADEILIRLRLSLRLLGDLDEGERAGLLPIAERLDAVGRQIGGWRRSIGVGR